MNAEKYCQLGGKFEGKEVLRGIRPPKICVA